MFDRYSVLDMFGPFYGENWHHAEIAEGVSFRWSGPDLTSNVRLPTLGAREIRIRWTLSILPQEEQIAGLIWTIDGVVAPLRWALRSGYATFWADVPVRTPAPSVLATITVPERRREPQDDAGDTRVLGLAVHKVEVFALKEEAIGEEARRLEQEVRLLHERLSRCEADKAAVLQSTSWKVSSPLRWLKRLGGESAQPSLSHEAGPDVAH